MRYIDVPDPRRRTCPACDRSLIVNADNFHMDSLCADGFTRKCAECRNEAARIAYRLAAPERARRVRERRAARRAHFESTGRYWAA
ncbi:hypothetical protein K388_00315 [Streptomyces sp. KhCrAH-43]|uniref:hypothetical protein n=1 Tax=unclassified Streptomyces TaxID=2593676 RepID=UPI000370D25C|nr:MULTISPECIES: hypothetical protein [unclassified Streptomyces]MYS37905.1 hypothetical protein [Streptomyces sp. SID4920]MYX66092.1 hypothetical protein [Streptomyces sp. SID8373]RAJ67575.1 hypothetical protein K388_00315 [Streptomyces sp. KhCrAH-43]